MNSIFRSLLLIVALAFNSQAQAVSCKDEIERHKKQCLEISGPPDMKREFKVVRYFEGGFESECTISWQGAVDVGRATAYCDGGNPNPTPTPTPNPTPTPPRPKDDPTPRTFTVPSVDKTSIQCASIIFTDNQVLGEEVRIVGTNFSLAYFTNKVSGRIGDYTLRIPLTSDKLDAGATQVKYAIKINGEVVENKALPIATNLSAQYVWNGKVNGSQNIGSMAAEVFVKQFPTGVATSFQVPMGSLQAKYLGFGLWLPTIYHFYDLNRKQVLRGDGSSLTAKAELLANNQLRVIDSDRSLIYIFDSLSGKHLQTKTFWLGALVYSFEHSANGLLNSISDAFGKRTLFNRNAEGDLVSITAPGGQVTQITLNNFKFISAIKNPAGQTYSVTYHNELGLLKTFRKPQGQVSSFSYDNLGNLIYDAHSGGHSINLEKNVVPGKPTQINSKSPMGRITNYTTDNQTYKNADGKDEVYYYKRVLNPDQTVVQSWAAESELSERKNGIDYFTYYTPDLRFKDFARTVTRNVASGTTLNTKAKTSENFELNDPANPFSIKNYSSKLTDAFGENTVTSYNGEKRIFTTQTADGINFKSQIDEFERVVAFQWGSYVPTTFSYKQDKLVRISQGNRIIENVYDPLTNLLTSTSNVLGQSTDYTYTKTGKLDSIQYPDGRKVIYNYDENDKLIAITPANKQKHNFSFNVLELPISYSPPLLEGEESTPTNYSYNVDKQLTAITFPDGSMNIFNYHQANGTLESIVTPEGTYNYRFNSKFGIYDGIKTPATLASYLYPFEGGFINQDVLEKEDAVVGAYMAFRNSLGRLVEDVVVNGVKGSPRIIFKYNYGPAGKISRIGNEDILYASDSGQISETKVFEGENTARDEFSYNQFGELNSYILKYHNKNALVDPTLYSYKLVRDDLGRIVKKVESINGVEVTYDYAYDLGGKLVEVKTNGTIASRYVYDANGNRVGGNLSTQSIKSVFDSQDRLSAYNTQNYKYNLKGDLVSKKNSITNQETSYVFNSLGQLAAVKSGSTAISYEYDGLRRRAQNFVNGVLQSTYIYQGPLRLTGVLDAEGNVLQRFGYASKSHAPDFMIMKGAVYRIVTDHLGSVRLVVRVSDGTIMQEMLHDEFGRILKNTNPGFQPFGFAGGLYDHNTNLVHFGARWYDPEIGRWISKDPIGFRGGDENLYGYVGSDPINYVDPSGRTQQDINQAIAFVKRFIPEIQNTSFGTLNSPGDSGSASVFNNQILLDSKYQGILNDDQVLDLLNTVYHEALHIQGGYGGLAKVVLSSIFNRNRAHFDIFGKSDAFQEENGDNFLKFSGRRCEKK